jgi:muramoyltetrapeptide carboxypeptidase
MASRAVVPSPIVPGARVRVVATSWAVDRPRLDEGLFVLRDMGLVPVLPANIDARDGFLAGSDAVRREALDEALGDPSAAVVWVAQGGSGATRLLPFLDPDRVRDAGKWLVGFSDATALHATWQRAGLASLHGPNVTTLPRWSRSAREELARCLFHGESPGLPARWASGWAAGVVEGPLVGGNLAVWASLAGTGALPPSEGAILFLEDVDEATHRLDRAAVQLLQAGALDGVKAIVLGQFTACESSHGDVRSAAEVLAAALATSDRPVAFGCPAGHERDARPVLLGVPHALGGGTLAPL